VNRHSNIIAPPDKFRIKQKGDEQDSMTALKKLINKFINNILIILYEANVSNRKYHSQSLG
jgi:hypothetical protein